MLEVYKQAAIEPRMMVCKIW